MNTVVGIGMILSICVVIANFVGLRPDWEAHQMQKPAPWVEWLLFFYLGVMGCGWISIIGITIKVLFYTTF